MTTLAEGIETAEELAFLRERGCMLGQGFLFSQPVPPEEIIAYAFGGVPIAAAMRDGRPAPDALAGRRARRSRSHARRRSRRVDARPRTELVGRAGPGHVADRRASITRPVQRAGRRERVEHRVAEPALDPVILDDHDQCRSRSSAGRSVSASIGFTL